MGEIKVAAGDVLRLFSGAFGDAIVTRVYLHESCGPRFDCERPYAFEADGGVVLYGFERVDFLDATREWDVTRAHDGRVTR
jgi:hypothetical protein